MEQELYILTDGLIITEEEVLMDHVLVIEGEKIKAVVPKKSIHFDNSICTVNCKGRYILPGLIDIHSDIIENIIVPRKGIIFDFDLALQEVDRQLITQGITTIYHSISIANSTICNRDRTLSVNEMLKIGDKICNRASDLLIHNRFHARLELNTLEAFDGICMRLKQKKIHELSLMNHAPGQGQYTDITNFKREIRNQYGDISDNEMDRIVLECQQKNILEPAQIDVLLNLARANDIPVAFHDIGTVEQIDFMIQNRINICEFPLSSQIAAEAAKRGLFNIVGAPNILKSRSQNNNASATELLKNGVAQIICSDYYSPAMLPSVFALSHTETITLPKAVSYATIYPARAIDINDKYGSIAPGKQADIIIVEIANNLPRVTTVFIDGKKKLEIQYEGQF
jgi:alpha-D-ribose 1-methylphosphonate 5-triphosphate diphosphatase